jgi:adenosylcobyric acid synthase
VGAPAPVLMVQGTASSVGKSTLVAGLCRLFARRGLRVAPFKAQNMSNNAAVCPDGGEIGRAQYAQAEAAGLPPTVDMNPILLKPQGSASQVVLLGRVHGRLAAADYLGPRRAALWPVVTAALDRLRRRVDLVIAEGAGSPAEINLRARDLVNMAVARYARADVLLVGDIDRGGVFAALLGTWEWLDADERARVRGFVLNKFRGDARLLAPAPELLERRTAVPVVGVVPYLEDLRLPEEDAASLAGSRAAAPLVEVAVVRLPHIANFDEFGPLAAEPGVAVRYVTTAHELRAPDLVVLPGTKATIADLLWLGERGLAERIRWLARHGTPVLGVCGGFQMLGERVSDPLRLESEHPSAPGLGVLPVTTELGPRKRLRRVRGVVRSAPGPWSALAGCAVAGYEIHQGRTTGAPGPPLLDLESGRDGLVSADGRFAGTYVHGLFETPALRHRLLAALAARRGLRWAGAAEPAPAPYDRLADVLERVLDLDPARFPALKRAAAGSAERHNRSA